MIFSKLLLKSFFGLLLVLSFNSIGQEQNSIKCSMSERQIVQSQSFDEDAPEAEEARAVFQEFITTLTFIYDNINNGQIDDVHVQLTAINSIIQKFQTLELNYSMFNDDIEFIQQYNP